MPVIPVECAVQGFSPSDYPIYWRLQCRHVLCRHQNQGHYHYSGRCEILENEWQGRSKSASFKLFLPATQTNVFYDYNSNDVNGPVMGGNCILSVAAQPPGCMKPLIDYVHIRIGGVNPSRDDVVRVVDRLLANRNENLPHMVKAIYTHENGFKQFEPIKAQTDTHFHIKQWRHKNPLQPDCDVHFFWPEDPAHFPSVAFDWGVGISQYTKTRGLTIGRDVTWDWRANVAKGINEFMQKMRENHKAGDTWRSWAHRSWAAYNGSEQYADTLAALPDGRAVSPDPIPPGTSIHALTAPIPETAASSKPPSWPSIFPPGDFPEVSTDTAPA
jgi:hypothetical protein